MLMIDLKAIYSKCYRLQIDRILCMYQGCTVSIPGVSRVADDVVYFLSCMYEKHHQVLHPKC